MLNFDSPGIRSSLAQAALHEPYPSWLLDSDGVIRSANLMAFWLWGGLDNSQAIQSDALVGWNIFDIQAANFERIPLSRNVEFYAKQSALVKRATANRAASPYASFIAAMKADPHMSRIYEDALASPEHIWEYRLVITAPENAERLELCVTNYRLEGEAGFLALTSPVGDAVSVMEAQYGQLITRYGEEAYILSDGDEKLREDRSFFANLPDSFRMYYPIMIQDPLWYIIEENRAQQLLFGGSAVGMHFFELYFTPQLRPWLAPLQETSAPRAMRYFETFTAAFQREEHELHEAYIQVLQRLLQLPDYRKLMELSWKSNIHLNLPDNKDIPFYACRVFLPWILNPATTLQFRSMVRYLHKGLLLNMDRQYYQEVMIPENYETEAALILLYLSSSLEEDMRGSFKQMLWGLTLLKTLQEGFKSLDRGDEQWDPEAAFRSIYHDVESQVQGETEEMREELTMALQKSLEALKRIVDVEVLLSLLKALAAKESLEYFGAFLEQEQGYVPRKKESGQLTL